MPMWYSMEKERDELVKLMKERAKESIPSRQQRTSRPIITEKDARVLYELICEHNILYHIKYNFGFKN